MQCPWTALRSILSKALMFWMVYIFVCVRLLPMVIMGLSFKIVSRGYKMYVLVSLFSIYEFEIILLI